MLYYLGRGISFVLLSSALTCTSIADDGPALDLGNEDMEYGLVFGSQYREHVIEVLSAAAIGYDEAIRTIRTEISFVYDLNDVHSPSVTQIEWTVVGIPMIEVAHGVLIRDPQLLYLLLDCGTDIYIAVDFTIDPHLIDPDTAVLQLAQKTSHSFCTEDTKEEEVVAALDE